MDAMRNIIRVLEVAGGELYGRERISQLAHALQVATLAERDNASPALIAAALLHDIGHMVDKRYKIGQEQNIDRHHEDIGAAYLSTWFSPAVTEPIRLHVPAKRYLCHVDDRYFASLSPASVWSLQVQGGFFSKEEADEYIAQPYAEDAARLRRWDDLAKDPACETPPLEHFAMYLERANAGAAA